MGQKGKCDHRVVTQMGQVNSKGGGREEFGGRIGGDHRGETWGRVVTAETVHRGE